MKERSKKRADSGKISRTDRNKKRFWRSFQTSRWVVRLDRPLRGKIEMSGVWPNTASTTMFFVIATKNRFVENGTHCSTLNSAVGVAVGSGSVSMEAGVCGHLDACTKSVGRAEVAAWDALLEIDWRSQGSWTRSRRRSLVDCASGHSLREGEA